LPALDAPACNKKGVRCGDGSTMFGPAHLKYLLRGVSIADAEHG
jgi:hypothetical protein